MCRCSRFLDSDCRILGPNEPEPDSVNESGPVCDQFATGWCSVAGRNNFRPPTQYLSMPHEYVIQFGCKFTRYAWLKVDAAPDPKRPHLLVWLQPDGVISCLGNATDNCLWHDYPFYGSEYENAVGQKCSDESVGWCKEVAAILRSEPTSTCTVPAATPTSSVSAVASPTGVPSSAGRLIEAEGRGADLTLRMDGSSFATCKCLCPLKSTFAISAQLHHRLGFRLPLSHRPAHLALHTRNHIDLLLSNRLSTSFLSADDQPAR